MNLKGDLMNRVKVIDARCGAGKTSYIIQYINKLDVDTKVIFVTPFISETKRVKEECGSRNFFLPNAQQGRGSKMNNFKDLIAKGRNIATTHALFANVTDDVLDLLRANSYILVLDEVMSVVEKLELYDGINLTKEENELLTKKDIATLINSGIMLVDEKTRMISWNENGDTLYKYEEIRNLAERQLLYYLDSGDLLIWTFPIDIFREGVFDEIYILTYQFEFQIQAYYYQYFNLEYEICSVRDVGGRNYELVEYDREEELTWRKEVAKLINICDNDKLNKIGNGYVDSLGREQTTVLSKAWFEKSSKKVIEVLRRNVVNYYGNVAKCKAKDRMWTCFKMNQKDFKDNYIPKKAWVALNARATNDYADKTVLVYPINRYLTPFLVKFFSMRDVRVDQDGYALSELIQWIFRSAIRKGEPIQIYIPSQRMRGLLLDWLDGKY